jgi:hypothetical protein
MLGSYDIEEKEQEIIDYRPAFSTNHHGQNYRWMLGNCVAF